jgi:hypothetical protein
MMYVKRYVSMNRVYVFIHYAIFVSGFSALLRTILSSCFIIDKLHRMAQL